MTIQELQIAPADRASLVAAADAVSRDEDRQFRRLLPCAAQIARSLARHWDFCAPASVIDELVQDTRAFPKATDPPNTTRLRRAAVARLALGFLRTDDFLPENVRLLYPEFLGRLAKSLLSDTLEAYEGEYFAKDVRYALGITLPCGALQFDLYGRIGPKLILRDVAATRSLQSALSYLTAVGWGRWYSIHLDLRAMKEFHPDGWTGSFARLAEMLQANPDVRGVCGVSWFYDPKVAEITPHLGYVQQTPTRYGAFLAHMGTAPHHVQNATVRSPIRKKAYEDGRYLPTCYLLAWPRRALLTWADRLKGDPTVRFAGMKPENAAAAGHPVFAGAAANSS